MSKLTSIFSRRAPKKKNGGEAPEAEDGAKALVHSPDAPFMRSINLLPEEFLPDTRHITWNPVHVAVGALIPLALVGIALLYLSASESADAATDERDEIAVQVQAVQSEVADEARTKGLSALANAGGAELATVVEGGLDARIAWDRVIDNVTRVMPDGLWIRTTTGVSLEDDKAEENAAPGTLRIDGTSTVGQEEIARFAARITTLRDIDSVTLDNVATTLVDEREVMEFTISATVKGPR